MSVEWNPKIVTEGDYLIALRGEHETEWGTVSHVEIHREDGEPIHNWYDLFNIKNKYFGTDRVAFEVYPSLDRLVDSVHAYHLWVMEEGFEPPFGIHREDRTT